MMKFSGVPEMKDRVKKEGNKKLSAMKNAMDYILLSIANDARSRAPFRDRTGNLRNSILTAGSESEIHTQPSSERRNPRRRPKSNASKQSKNKLVGYVYAGMEYATQVEFRPGFWVLGDAWRKGTANFSKKISDLVRRAG